MIRAQCLGMVLALTLGLAASSAVMPVVPLRDMAPEHACLFICDICLNGAPEQELMSCVNTICRRITPRSTCGPVLDLDMMWLGNRCHDFDIVMQLMGGDQKKH